MESKYYEYDGGVFRIDQDDKGRYKIFGLRDNKWVKTSGTLIPSIHWEGLRIRDLSKLPPPENS